MSRISDEQLRLNEDHWVRNEAWHKKNDIPFYGEGALQLDLRDARSEIARLTEDNGRLDASLSCVTSNYTAQLDRATDLKARLAAATTVTEQLAAALQPFAVTGAGSISDIRRADTALTAFVAFKQAGAGEGDTP